MKLSTSLLFMLGMTPLTGFSQPLTISSEYGLPVVNHATEIDETGWLSKFDSNLGTLTGATLILYGGAEFSLSASNFSGQSQTARLTSDTELTFTIGEMAVNDFIQAQNSSIYLSASTPLTAIASGQTINFGPYSTNDSFSYDLSSLLASVQAAGSETFSINAQSLSGITVLGGGGNIGTTQSTLTGAGAKITYTYTPVPEPSSAFLCGIAGLALLARRRR